MIAVLERLVDEGHTVCVIEHNPDILLAADYLIDLGPEGGDDGGRIVAQGTPETVAENFSTPTSQFLKTLMEKPRPRPTAARKKTAEAGRSHLKKK